MSLITWFHTGISFCLIANSVKLSHAWNVFIFIELWSPRVVDSQVVDTQLDCKIFVSWAFGNVRVRFNFNDTDKVISVVSPVESLKKRQVIDKNEASIRDRFSHQCRREILSDFINTKSSLSQMSSFWNLFWLFIIRFTSKLSII